MRIVQITTDSREHYKDYSRSTPYFGTAPQGLLEGFERLPDAEIHVISCSQVPVEAPAKLAPNIWYHQATVGKWGWGRTLFAGCVKEVRKLVRKIDPDIVHGQGTERDCAISAVLSGYPNVLTIHGNMRVHARRPESSSTYYRIAALLETFCLQRTDGVVAISRYTDNLVKDLTPRTWLIPNAADSRFFDIQPDLSVRVPRILFVGALNERKNPAGLLDACSDLLRAGACTLAFAGEGDGNSNYLTAFGKRCRELPGVEMLGFVGRDDLADQFSRSTLLILPTFEDNCPMVVLEAMAAGVPVAASRVGGIPDLIEDKVDGFLFDPANLSDMTACVHKLVSDENVRRQLAANARAKALSEFHPSVVASQHLRAYQDVLSI